MYQSLISRRYTLGIGRVYNALTCRAQTERSFSQNAWLSKQKAKQAEEPVATERHRKSKAQKTLDEVEKEYSEFYESIYGTARWTQLHPSLKSPQRYSCLLNKYSSPEENPSIPDSMQELKLEKLPFKSLECFQVSEDIGGYSFPRPEKNETTGLLTHYLLDAGSVLATEALDIQPGEHVLDMCASPGGKSLCILQRMSGVIGGHLTSNEPSPTRRKTLSRVMAEYIPKEFNVDLRITGEEGWKFLFFGLDRYDKVLVDAPCSSDRHILHDSSEFKLWTPSRSKNLAKRQFALLQSALKVVRPGGTIVYSTCALSELENDGVIERALNKSKVPFEIVQENWPLGEKTKHGWICLPDAAHGYGPLYFAKLKKL
ncbi:S-adenosyl-L-methionine-dependent methyltransferase [Basidiobolus meristosporus CBS 931.73]|uniref:NOL1/NOP2/Sun domain family member 4 n=1 Tax=Basidiobolus meristosporus CBS 931.73 TaxID=1314790 RepID=A0A1Y1ZDP0_9FUNG|nr:S-adenosyl-L-methionine-dependent methyltransferase [Basidiobolus meristosporus CBS 931.73]|eukprot:ORY08294.1 S-adenosyl-L-methionine-dependent methyltransferase [Basidiobolus meristosporus CBS 931.73]